MSVENAKHVSESAFASPLLVFADRPLRELDRKERGDFHLRMHLTYVTSISRFVLSRFVMSNGNPRLTC